MKNVQAQIRMTSSQELSLFLLSECPLTLSSNAIEKIGPNLKAHPDIANVLGAAGFGANNHIYDYGQQGLLDALKILKNSGLAYVGAGVDLKEAQEPFFTEIKGVRLSFINIGEIEFSSAGPGRGGANPMDLIDNFHQIQNAKRNADHVIVIIHGGHEYYHYPSPQTLKRYRFYAESGASVVIAHHTHCIGGYEVYKGVPIFYSLGNFHQGNMWPQDAILEDIITQL
jgi:poly-gamma-glutamate synthesis protein (capsule biosynthesis protein)